MMFFVIFCLHTRTNKQTRNQIISLYKYTNTEKTQKKKKHKITIRHEIHIDGNDTRGTHTNYTVSSGR